MAPNFDLSPYGYTPSLIMAAVFLAIFTISGIAHGIQAFSRGSPRWMIVMSIGALLEILGWSGRLWSRYSLMGGGYIMQQCCLVIGPTFFSAALYMLLGVAIGEVAPDKSRLSAKQFKIAFIVADVFSIILQGCGGGLAGSAEENYNQLDLGSNIMLAGIVVQLVVMIIYVVYGFVWAYKARADIAQNGGRKFQLLGLGMSISSLAIIVRGVYRTIELSQGFHGALAGAEMTFLLDAIPSSIAILALNFFHPHFLFPQSRAVAASPVAGSTETLRNLDDKSSSWYSRKSTSILGVEKV